MTVYEVDDLKEELYDTDPDLEIEEQNSNEEFKVYCREEYANDIREILDKYGATIENEFFVSGSSYNQTGFDVTINIDDEEENDEEYGDDDDE